MLASQRAVLILKILETGKAMSKEAIAKRLSTSIRTVFRDLALLRGMNVPIRISNSLYTLDKRAWNRWTGQQIGQAIRKCNKRD